MRRTTALLVLCSRATTFTVRGTARFSVVERAMSGDCRPPAFVSSGIFATRARAGTTTVEEREEARAMRAGGAGGASAVAADVEGCAIDEGVQKYVLVRAGDRYFVRGNAAASYHKDAARPLVEDLRLRDVAHEVLGGGRIKLETADQTCHIYGHSFGFPWQGEFRHDLAARVVEEAYPGFEVTTSNEGY